MSDTRQKKGRSFRLATPPRLVTRRQACSLQHSANPYARLGQLGRPLTSQHPLCMRGFLAVVLFLVILITWPLHSRAPPQALRVRVPRQVSRQSLDLQPDRETGLLNRAKCWRRPCPRGHGLGQGLVTNDPARPVLVIADFEHRFALPPALTCIKKRRSGYVCTFVSSMSFLLLLHVPDIFASLQKQQNG